MVMMEVFIAKIAQASGGIISPLTHRILLVSITIAPESDPRCTYLRIIK